MKRYKQIILAGILITISTLFSGCGTQGVLAIGKDYTLPNISNVKHLVSNGSVGFEWSTITNSRVAGIKVYRTLAGGKRYKRIATLDDRFSSHFVDSDVLPNRDYIYKFVTYSTFKESTTGYSVEVHTKDAYEPISFTKAYMLESGVVKVLWKLHPRSEIVGYIIERKIDGGSWKYLARVSDRLMPEYVDRSAAIGYSYSYRVIAVSGNGAKSLPSTPSHITVR